MRQWKVVKYENRYNHPLEYVKHKLGETDPYSKKQLAWNAAASLDDSRDNSDTLGAIAERHKKANGRFPPNILQNRNGRELEFVLEAAQ